MRKIAFAPIVSPDSKILLLGTMPGEESLRLGQYYGHRNNQFWKLLYNIYKIPFSEDYEQRKALLLDNGLALWDVLQSCEGKGSLDSNIINEQPNDFVRFFKHYPHISHVVFTSRKAEELYRRYIGFDSSREYMTLPSPSPANARMTFDEKLRHWKVLSDVI